MLNLVKIQSGCSMRLYNETVALFVHVNGPERQHARREELVATLWMSARHHVLPDTGAGRVGVELALDSATEILAGLDVLEAKVSVSFNAEPKFTVFAKAALVEGKDASNVSQSQLRGMLHDHEDFARPWNSKGAAIPGVFVDGGVFKLDYSCSSRSNRLPTRRKELLRVHFFFHEERKVTCGVMQGSWLNAKERK